MSNISQDRRGEPEPQQLLSGNTIIYVEYTTANGFRWGLNQASMVSLSTTITTTSSTAITYEFVHTGSVSIWYKLPPSTPNGTVLPTSSGPTTVVAPGTRTSIAFATSSGGPYSTGYVKVSGDGFDHLDDD